MSKLIILQGPPCAGKTTYARNMVVGRDDIIIVSPDDIRHALGDYWVPKRESLVSELENHAIYTALMKGFDVISDAINLSADRQKKLSSVAARAEALVETVQLYVPFREALRRDTYKDRRHHVGERIIREKYEKYFPERLAEELAQPEPEMMPAVDQSSGRSIRLITTPDGETIWTPTQQDLDDVKKLAILRYPISKIAKYLDIPESEFRRLLTSPDNQLSQAYHSGKIESEIAYRDKVRQMAERGEEWAIKILERWAMEQVKQELGMHE